MCGGHGGDDSLGVIGVAVAASTVRFCIENGACDARNGFIVGLIACIRPVLDTTGGDFGRGEFCCCIWVQFAGGMRCQVRRAGRGKNEIGWSDYTRSVPWMGAEKREKETNSVQKTELRMEGNCCCSRLCSIIDTLMDLCLCQITTLCWSYRLCIIIKNKGGEHNGTRTS